MQGASFEGGFRQRRGRGSACCGDSDENALFRFCLFNLEGRSSSRLHLRLFRLHPPTFHVSALRTTGDGGRL
jgi:hypothetical protein